LEGLADAQKAAEKNLKEADDRFATLQTYLSKTVNVWNAQKERLQAEAEQAYQAAPRDRQPEFGQVQRAIVALKPPATGQASDLVFESNKLSENARWNVNRAFDQAQQEGKECAKLGKGTAGAASPVSNLKQRASNVQDEYVNALDASVLRWYVQRVKKMDDFVEHAKRILAVEIPAKKEKAGL